MCAQSTIGSGSDATELRRIKEERISTQKCLQICAQLSEHINEIELTPELSGNAPGAMGPDTLPKRLTANGLEECKTSLALTSAKLDRHMKELVDRLVTESKAGASSEEHLADIARLREEWETTQQCMEICSKAGTYLKETTSIIDNYATGDAVQFMVSTDGKTLHGSNRGLGWRSRQVGGHLSDATVQQISRDFTAINIGNSGRESPSLRGTEPARDSETKVASDSKFQERYGPGFVLASETSAAMATTTAGAEEGSLRSAGKK